MARSADSRPDPGPETSTSSMRMPCSPAFLTASSAAIWAAKGVDLREPLKPIVPAEDQEMVLPCASVMVIIVLLNVELTWATPDTMFLRSLRRTRVASLAMGSSFRRARSANRQIAAGFRLLLLARDRLRLPLAGARVGVRALAANRQLLAVAKSAIGAQIHQTLDIDGYFPAEIAFDHIIAVDRLADLQHLGVAELRYAAIGRNMHFLDNFLGLLRADAVNILQRDDHALVGRNVYACYARHGPISISAASDLARRLHTTQRPVEAGPCRVDPKRKKSHALVTGAGTQNTFGMALI